MARFSILTMMKDEGPRILEWLAYHRLIGADDIWVYTNDCRDGSDAMLDRLEAMGLCRHIRNAVPPGKKPQPHALKLAEQAPALAQSEWLLVMDGDEFLHIKTGDGTLPALLAACPTGTEGVAVNWRMMGSNGHRDWSPDGVLTQFTRGAPDDFRRGWGVKTLFRPFAGMKLGIHRPALRGAGEFAPRWVNGSGMPLPPSFLADGWRGSAATVGYGLAEIAHFAVQSREAYVLRGDRGNVNLKPDKYDATYFAVFDRNEDPHLGLLGWSGWVEALVECWVQDKTLKRLTQASIDWHAQRLADLRREPGFGTQMAALDGAHGMPIAALDALLFTQPLPPEGKRRVAELRARGLPDAEIARIVAVSVAKLEAARDAREAAELHAMGAGPVSWPCRGEETARAR
jgi:hypothetical protein